MKTKKLLLGAAISSITLGIAGAASAESFTEALTEGKAFGDIRIRYESVDQDNALDDASALTMRTRIGYKTGTVNGFSAVAEFEDVRVVGGIDDYSVPPAGFQTGEYSVIADPEVTELDQGFLQYKAGKFTAKLGRQVIVHDNHRFVGHVGWRQDRQTFDALTLNFAPTDKISLTYNYIDERERIFGEAADIDSEDHLFNAGFVTPVGKITGYAYLLEMDNGTNNSHDTIGVRFAGKKNKFIYSAEFASQSNKTGAWDPVAEDDIEYDTNYLMGEFGYNFGPVTLKGQYELLGSDDGNGAFSTPLATLHKFNGWADVFLGTPAAGLEDVSVSVSGKVGGFKLAATYHDYSSDEGSVSYGDELNLVASTMFGKHYNAGFKAAFYSADELGVDTDKVWLWIGAKF